MKTYKNLLKEFIRFKTISTSNNYIEDIENAVNWLTATFKSKKFKTNVIRGYDNPIILADYVFDNNLPTCLIYGHYDVQPVDETNWNTNPFELSSDSNKLYGRGVIDNKGQVLVHIATVFDLIEEDSLKYNIKFILEGNEETGSPNIDKFIVDNKNKLAADFILVSDGSIINNHPVIELDLRGITNYTIELKTSDRVLHSGMYGGAVPNAAFEMSVLLSKLYTKDNKVALDGFYNNVEPISKSEITNNHSIPFSEESHFKLTGTKALLTEPEYDFHSQVGLRPTIQVTGLESGYNGEGYKTGVPNIAMAKLNIRLVAKQNIDQIDKSLELFLNNNLPKYVDYRIIKPQKAEGVVEAVKLDINSKYIEIAKELLSKIYGKDVLYKYVGGTIPLIYHIQSILKIPQLLILLANEDCNMHGAQENFSLPMLEKALQFSNKFLRK